MDTRDTDIIELKTFIGLLLMTGAYRAARLNTKDLWDKDGPSIFSITMSYKCFLFLYRCILFDDISSRYDRETIDKLETVVMIKIAGIRWGKE